jgi:hypothetical protein
MVTEFANGTCVIRATTLPKLCACRTRVLVPPTFATHHAGNRAYGRRRSKVHVVDRRLRRTSLSFHVAQRADHALELRARELHSFDRDATVRKEIAQVDRGAPTDAAAMVGKLGRRDLQFGELCGIATTGQSLVHSCHETKPCRA